MKLNVLDTYLTFIDNSDFSRRTKSCDVPTDGIVTVANTAERDP